MALDYTEHTWGYGEEFTPDKLNNMEHGIKEASDAVNEVNNNLNKAAQSFDISFIENGVLVEKRLAQYQKIGNIVFINMIFKYTSNALYSKIHLPVIPSRVAPWGMQVQYNDIIGYVEYNYFVLQTPENLWNTENEFRCGFFYFCDTDATWQ